MNRSVFPLLAILVFFSLGSQDAFVGCGLGGDTRAGIACVHGGEDDPCDYIVTLHVTVLLASDNSPIQGATATIGNDPPDEINTKATDENGQAYWDDTSFITGFSAECSDRTVGTVEVYDQDTVFTHDVIVTAQGYAPALTVFSIDRDTRKVEIIVSMESLW